MAKRRVVTVLGTRPEIIRLSRVIAKLDRFTEHYLVHTGQNNASNLNDVFFRDLSLRAPDFYLGVDTSSLGSVMGETLSKCETIFRELRPDAVVILGDTNSSMAAIIAERLHIPVYHLEAGNRSWDANVPEELNRRLVDHVATFNLPYNSYSYQNLLQEGLHSRFLCRTGSPIREIYDFYEAKIRESKILESLQLTKGNYFLASFHRQENVDSPNTLLDIIAGLRQLAISANLPVIISVHPRTQKRLADIGNISSDGLVFIDALGYLDYCQLQLNAKCVLSDSGTISEESEIMGFRAVCLRSSTERAEGFGVGSNVPLVGANPDSLVQAVEWAMLERPRTSLPDGYEVTDFSERVVGFVLSTCHLANEWLGRRQLPK